MGYCLGVPRACGGGGKEVSDHSSENSFLLGFLQLVFTLKRNGSGRNFDSKRVVIDRLQATAVSAVPHCRPSSGRRSSLGLAPVR